MLVHEQPELYLPLAELSFSLPLQLLHVFEEEAGVHLNELRLLTVAHGYTIVETKTKANQLI